MNIHHAFIAVLIYALCSCKNFSPYAIDEHPLVKIDTNLLGIWKAVEDTNKKDFILVQNFTDVARNLNESFKKEAAYIANQKKEKFTYFITRFDNDGTNPHFQQFHCFISLIKGQKFLNIEYEIGSADSGFLFERIIKINKSFDTITTAIIADTTMRELHNSVEVRKRIEQNINKPSFYSDTLHFYRVNNYHADIRKVVEKAN